MTSHLNRFEAPTLYRMHAGSCPIGVLHRNIFFVRSAWRSPEKFPRKNAPNPKMRQQANENALVTSRWGAHRCRRQCCGKGHPWQCHSHHGVQCGLLTKINGPETRTRFCVRVVCVLRSWHKANHENTDADFSGPSQIFFI